MSIEKLSITEPLITKYGYAVSLGIDGLSIKEAADYLLSFDSSEYSKIFVDYYGGPDDTYLTILGTRKETDEEYAARLAVIFEREEKITIKERKQYEKLKKKFEGK